MPRPPAPTRQSTALLTMKADVPEWLAEILHVVKGIADREHQWPLPVLTPAHAQAALDAVPRDILSAAGIRFTEPDASLFRTIKVN